MAKFTRRGLIQGAALGAAVTAAAPYALPPAQPETWSWNTGRETFHFTGYVHGSSFQENALQSIDPEKEFPQPVDGIFMEDASAYLDPSRDFVYQAMSEGRADDIFLIGPTLKYCRERNIPLFLGDLSFKADSEILQKITDLTANIETFAGSLAAARITRPQTLGRRRFLGAGLALGFAAWGVAPSALYLLNKEGGKRNLAGTDTQTRRDIEATLSDRAHPERPIVLARNALWAKKLFFLGGELRERGIKHPEIGIMGGFGHRYLDFFLRHPDEIDGVLSMYKGLMENTAVSKEYLYKILELHLREGSFTKQILRVPELERTYLEREAVSLEAKG